MISIIEWRNVKRDGLPPLSPDDYGHQESMPVLCDFSKRTEILTLRKFADGTAIWYDGDFEAAGIDDVKNWAEVPRPEDYSKIKKTADGKGIIIPIPFP